LLIAQWTTAIIGELSVLYPYPRKIIDAPKDIEHETLKIDGEIETLIPLGHIVPLGRTY
jgi:hypothetical protein